MYLRFQILVEILAIGWLLVLLPLVIAVVVEHLVGIVRCVGMGHLDVAAEALRTVVIVLLVLRVATSAALCLAIDRKDKFVVRPRQC